MDNISNTDASPDTVITISDWKQSFAKDLEKLKNKDEFFKINTAAEWIEEAKSRPVPKMLFGEFWHESELCILFADTNLGKSILAVQIARSISEGIPIAGFTLQAEKQTVLYFDFELSDKQFEARYSKNYEDHCHFDENFLRAEINPDYEYSNQSFNFEDYLVFSLEERLKSGNIKIVIIDNITYLKNDTEKAKNALPLMHKLKYLKSKYSLSLLIIAHTPKRDSHKPLNRNDLQGSKMLINHCDSAFAIGESFNDPSVRYLKQIKCRNTELIYHSENVCLCRIDKPFNFLLFEFLEYAQEREHLRQISDQDLEQRDAEIIRLNDEGKSKREIGRMLNISDGTVRNRLKKLEGAQDA